MAIVEANPNLGAQIVEDAKEFVLYSWSVQSQIEPIAVAGAEGRHFWDYDGQALPRLRLAARQRQHRSPAPADHSGDQGPGRPALHDRASDGERVPLPARADARRGDAGRPLRLVLHERRRRGERERGEARAPRDGPPQDHRPLPVVPRGDERRGDADRRSSPLGGRARDARRRADVRPVHVSLPGRSSRSVSRSARARRTSRRSSSTRAHTPSPP